MDPVEIDAGGWHLRPPRHDERLSDVPAVLESARDPEILRWRHRPPPTPAAAVLYIEERAAAWALDRAYTWAVCGPTTGEMLGEVAFAHLDLPMGVAEATCWALPRARGRGMISTALSAVLRFGFAPSAVGGLGLARVSYAWAVGNDPSARVAEKCGFAVEGTQRSAWVVDGRRVDCVMAGRLATDR
ncbi:MAG: GNAT family N-acetyltransferase [Pseudonocardia sp.]|nr:GNAT family N-acetyltransferase [Pseudonocardia sp.]